jgi:hypothetical protein
MPCHLLLFRQNRYSCKDDPANHLLKDIKPGLADRESTRIFFNYSPLIVYDIKKNSLSIFFAAMKQDTGLSAMISIRTIWKFPRVTEPSSSETVKNLSMMGNIPIFIRTDNREVIDDFFSARHSVAEIRSPPGFNNSLYHLLPVVNQMQDPPGQDHIT